MVSSCRDSADCMFSEHSTAYNVFDDNLQDNIAIGLSDLSQFAGIRRCIDFEAIYAPQVSLVGAPPEALREVQVAPDVSGA